MSQWSLEPIWNSVPLAISLAIVLIGLAVLSPRFGKLSVRRQRILQVLRLLVIVLMLLALLRPTHIFTSTTARRSVLAILFDRSRSMQLPNGGGSEGTRYEAEKQALAKISAHLADVARNADIRAYAYDAQLHAAPIENNHIQVEAMPTGEQTDLALLEQVLQRETGKRLEAVLLLGDGTQTVFGDSNNAVVAARRMRDEFAAPLFTIPFGPAGDAAQAKDVAIERLDEQYTVFVKNEVLIRGRLKIAGYANQPIELQLLVSDPKGQETLVGKLTRSAKLEGEGLDFEFPYIPETPGHFKVTVRAAIQPGELVIKNNELSAYLTVLEGGLRVLLVDSGKRPEFKFLRRSLNDSPDIELDDLIIDSLNRKAWPVNLGATISQGKYDVFLLGNVPAPALGDTQLKELATQVENGKGLLVLGGTRAFGAGNYGNTALAEMLPITFDRFEKQDFDAPDRPDLFLSGAQQLTATGSHPVTRLADAAENEAAWQRLPPLDFANKFSGIKQSPGVRVLLTGPGNPSQAAPLLVRGEYGNGRVLAFAGESTYRWPLRGFAAQHKRFWRQSILWLARRDESQESNVWLKLPQRRYPPGANIPFTFGAKSPEGDELPDANFTAAIIGPDGKSKPLQVGQSGGSWSGTTSAKASGEYAIEITASRKGQPLGNTRAEFLIFDQDVELSNAAADHENLGRLAAITKEFGGRLVPVEQLDALLTEIAEKPPEMEVRQQKWRLSDSPTTAWLWLIAFASLLGTEWWLRKRWGLV